MDDESPCFAWLATNPDACPRFSRKVEDPLRALTTCGRNEYVASEARRYEGCPDSATRLTATSLEHNKPAGNNAGRTYPYPNEWLNHAIQGPEELTFDRLACASRCQVRRPDRASAAGGDLHPAPTRLGARHSTRSQERRRGSLSACKRIVGRLLGRASPGTPWLGRVGGFQRVKDVPGCSRTQSRITTSSAGHGGPSRRARRSLCAARCPFGNSSPASQRHAATIARTRVRQSRSNA